MTMNFTQIQITIYQIKKKFIMKEKRGWALMYIRNDLTYKIWNGFCISDEDRDIATIELLTKNMKIL